mmetsp:Transcript_73386/g.85261  ORF Transcript_73386/g.85261 Transcript_73386/m.85261 type:complete len:382 (-) Transcript_73386:236-1381(-)|eukprot:CAMPEP_0176424760 /NCGR_PEP_ID=MMETSP0127-20121128/11017_1 /TAXON_ID=938130 /ORGANISM="Platyophrya macrostoma, Strain WH" /LENGTH=381 /DNA_ID=CAMNT_0017805855 /DNA_START=444 /DNA_END=1589 /DNA_ORIENTATION=+
MSENNLDQIKDLGDDVYEIYGNFKDLYEEFEELGQGYSAIVKRFVCKKTNDEFAVKVVSTGGDEELEQLLKNEFLNRRMIKHKNIVGVYKMYIDRLKMKVYTVMEFVPGKEMLEFICDNGHYSESEASKLFKQLLHAVQFLHTHGVVHRDLKPQNILIMDENSMLKLTDFNVSKFNKNEENSENKTWKYSAFSKENIKMWTYTGTVTYLAPEVLQDLEYSEAVDMWSAGVVLFMMLSGRHPFASEEVEDLIEEIKNFKLDFKDKCWESISEEAKDLLYKLLQKDFNKRITPFDALNHPWITTNGGSRSRQNSKMAENFRNNYVGNKSKGLQEPKSALLKQKTVELDHPMMPNKIGPVVRATTYKDNFLDLMAEVMGIPKEQ